MATHSEYYARISHICGYAHRKKVADSSFLVEKMCDFVQKNGEKLCIVSLMSDKLTLAQECVNTATPEPISSADLFFSRLGQAD